MVSSTKVWKRMLSNLLQNVMWATSLGRVGRKSKEGAPEFLYPINKVQKKKKQQRNSKPEESKGGEKRLSQASTVVQPEISGRSERTLSQAHTVAGGSGTATPVTPYSPATGYSTPVSSGRSSRSGASSSVSSAGASVGSQAGAIPPPTADRKLPTWPSSEEEKYHTFIPNNTYVNKTAVTVFAPFNSIGSYNGAPWIIRGKGKYDEVEFVLATLPKSPRVAGGEKHFPVWLPLAKELEKMRSDDSKEGKKEKGGDRMEVDGHGVKYWVAYCPEYNCIGIPKKPTTEERTERLKAFQHTLEQLLANDRRDGQTEPSATESPPTSLNSSGAHTFSGASTIV